MKYITVEQFKEQPLEVQKVFLDWWKCDYGDLYYYNEYPLEYKDFEVINSDLESDIEGDFDYFKSIGAIPIFTEGQLREFIEDKVESKILTINFWGGYSFKFINDKTISALRNDLLQAYWKVACEIAKEECKR